MDIEAVRVEMAEHRLDVTVRIDGPEVGLGQVADLPHEDACIRRKAH